jgi:putative hydrolase of the HAD superfamily
MPGQIKAVLFDLDNTLADRVSAFRRMVGEIWEAEPRLRECVSVEEAVAAFEEWDADGSTFPKRKIFEMAKSRWGRLGRNPRELESWYYANYGRCFEPDKRVDELICRLDELVVPWAIITNGPPFQVDAVRAIGLFDRAAGTIVSSLFGSRKPDPAIFHAGMRLVGVKDPSDILFVGDNPVADIEGARVIGMRTAWVRRGRHWPDDLPHPIVAIDHVSELATLFDM